MPAPSFVPALPHIPHLPPRLQDLASRCLTEQSSSSDHLLLLADACEEMSPLIGTKAITDAVQALVDELRRRASEYA